MGTGWQAARKRCRAGTVDISWAQWGACAGRARPQSRLCTGHFAMQAHDSGVAAAFSLATRQSPGRRVATTADGPPRQSPGCPAVAARARPPLHGPMTTAWQRRTPDQPDKVRADGGPPPRTGSLATPELPGRRCMGLSAAARARPPLGPGTWQRRGSGALTGNQPMSGLVGGQHHGRAHEAKPELTGRRYAPILHRYAKQWPPGTPHAHAKAAAVAGTSASRHGCPPEPPDNVRAGGWPCPPEPPDKVRAGGWPPTRPGPQEQSRALSGETADPAGAARSTCTR